MMAADVALPTLISPSVTETDDVGGWRAGAHGAKVVARLKANVTIWMGLSRRTMNTTKADEHDVHCWRHDMMVLRIQHRM